MNVGDAVEFSTQTGVIVGQVWAHSERPGRIFIVDAHQAVWEIERKQVRHHMPTAQLAFDLEAVSA